MRFDFVRCELAFVPEARQPELLQRLLTKAVAPRGRLILCGYGSPRSSVSCDPVRQLTRTYGFDPEVEFEQEAPEGGGPIVEIAVLRAD